MDTGIKIDLCASSYDTKVYVYDATGALIDCNDDYYFEGDCYLYSSCIECLALTGSVTYYIVVDGYGGDCGDYVLDITECDPYATCVQCPADGVAENEPPCYDWATTPDTWNGGCNSAPAVFQILTPECDGTISVCGWGGADAGTRDTDWYQVTFSEAASISLCCQSDILVNVFVLTANCDTVVTLGEMYDVGCDVMCLYGDLDPGTYWLWVGANDYSDIPCGQYLLTLEGYYPPGGASATERTSWGTIKNQYK